MRIHSGIKTLFLQSCVLVLASSIAVAEPMLSPTIEEACKSSAIIEAEYVTYSHTSWFKSSSYFQPPIASYKKIDQIRGAALPDSIAVVYEFHDGSACIEPSDWKFSDKLLPEKGSKWILFLLERPEGEKAFRTYRGDYGRMQISREELIKRCSAIWSSSKL